MKQFHPTIRKADLESGRRELHTYLGLPICKAVIITASHTLAGGNTRQSKQNTLQIIKPVLN